MEIFVGIASSVIASLIWWSLSSFYEINVRKNWLPSCVVNKNNYSYQKFLYYKDCDLALNQLCKNNDNCGELYKRTIDTSDKVIKIIKKYNLAEKLYNVFFVKNVIKHLLQI